MANPTQSSYNMEEERAHLYDFPHATPDTLTKEYLEKLIAELEYQGSCDPEVAHSLEKTAMECFITNVVAKKYTVEEASIIGKLILDIQKIPFSRWFA
jgi:hypothetical protein